MKIKGSSQMMIKRFKMTLGKITYHKLESKS